ncbi:MAG: esterase-like activity of phytase family protein [Actinomycetota bacterium]
MFRTLHRRSVLIAVIALAMLLALPIAATAKKGGDAANTVAGVEFLGEAIVDSGTMFDGTVIGGLSSITYDRARGVYHAISDDQGDRPSGDPVRYYSMEIDLSDGFLDDGDVTFVDVRQIYDHEEMPFAPGGLDPEGIVLARQGQFFVSSEGKSFAEGAIDPFIRRYNRNGVLTAEMPIPAKYLPNGVDWGVRFNLGFESLNMTPDGRHLVTAAEDALFQDGPKATDENGSLARILVFDARKRVPVAEYVYEVDLVAENDFIFGVNGIVEVLPIDNTGTMLVLERSFSVLGTLGDGTGNYVVLHEVSTDGATDVLDIDALYESGSPIAFDPVSKTPLFWFDDLGIPIDNIEGMTFGPDLPDGRKTLVIVSDDNFNDFGGAFTQFFVLALDIQPAG